MQQDSPLCSSFFNIDFLSFTNIGILSNHLKQLKELLTPERFQLEYNLILTKLPPRNQENAHYYQLLEDMANQTAHSFSKDQILPAPQLHKLIVAGTDIRCGAELCDSYGDGGMFIEVTSLAAPEFYLKVWYNDKICEGRWVDLLGQAPNCDFCVSFHQQNELRVTIDAQNYVVINLDYLFKPSFTIQYFDLKINEVVTTTNQKLGIETHSLSVLLKQMKDEFGYFDKVFSVRSISSTFESELHPLPHLSDQDNNNEKEDIILREGDLIRLITVECSLCKSAKDMPLQPHNIEDEYLCICCFKNIQSIYDFFKEPKNTHCLLIKNNNVHCLHKSTEADDSHSLRFSIFSRFTELQASKRQKTEGDTPRLSQQMVFEISSEVESTYLTSIDNLHSFVLQRKQQGYSFIIQQPGDENIHFTLNQIN